MNAHQLALIPILLSLLGTGHLIAQPPAVDSLKIIPASPTTDDAVKVVAYTTWGITPCALAGSSFETSNNTVTVFATNGGIGIFFPCSSTDTISIGTLGAGNYSLIYNVGEPDSQIIYDADTIDFIVQQPDGMPLIDRSNLGIKIFPNPFSTSATILLDDKLFNTPFEIRLYDMFGREVKRINQVKNKETTIDGNALTVGMYFVAILQDGEMIAGKKVMLER